MTQTYFRHLTAFEWRPMGPIHHGDHAVAPNLLIRFAGLSLSYKKPCSKELICAAPICNTDTDDWRFVNCANSDLRSTTEPTEIRKLPAATSPHPIRVSMYAQSMADDLRILSQNHTMFYPHSHARTTIVRRSHAAFHSQAQKTRPRESRT